MADVKSGQVSRLQDQEASPVYLTSTLIKLAAKVYCSPHTQGGGGGAAGLGQLPHLKIHVALWEYRQDMAIKKSRSP